MLVSNSFNVCVLPLNSVVSFIYVFALLLKFYRVLTDSLKHGP